MTTTHARRTYFLSHSTGDDDTVRRLADALADLDTPLTIDSRALRGGDPLESAIFRAIEDASGLLVLVSPRAHGSRWVGKELKYALALQQRRGGPAAFPVVPLLLDGTALGSFEGYFDEAPLNVSIRSTALDAALHDILVALRLREPTDAGAHPQPPAEPVEELLLELTEPRVHTRADGSRRATARARLVHVPANATRREVHSARFKIEAPLGVIEAADLRWYLEDYAVWPSPLLAERARRIEGQLEAWGRQLHNAALPAASVAEVLRSWAAVADAQVARRFSIEVDGTPDPDTPEAEALAMREAATQLLALPWELLHDGRSYLFQGAKPVRVRRRLPNDHPVPVPVLATPIRVLLASPRPEDDACGYIDHRASAAPLVEAMEALAGQVELHLLAPPTLPALREELDRARNAGTPYHVLHFDGHGVYDPQVGLGALCFEHAEDGRQPRGQRRHAAVASPELGALLRDHGIALVFLEACQSAQAERASESVASELLKTGVGSVVAMSHSVLVETSRRFVEAFYRALSRGARVGGAMLAGQRELKDNPVRGRVFGAGDFSLQDWFVPVLFQDRDDPQLFQQTPAPQTLEDWRARLKKRLGALPPPPEQGFIGRSRELLTLERLLAETRYAVLRGQGGEGKTALAAEFARWRVRSRQTRRAAFVSVESHGHAQAVLDVLGQQLVHKHYSATSYPNLDAATEPLLRELREHTTLLVIDNLESVLSPPFADLSPAADGTSAALAADEQERAAAILALAAQLGEAGNTRIVFTSREALPAPFNGETQRIELQRLSREDAVKLVERSLGLDAGGKGLEADAQREQIEALVEAVHGHARTLALLAPTLKAHGAAATQAELTQLMAQMEQRFPGQREQSLLASVELSLRRLPPTLRERIKVLGVFHGAVDLDVLRHMTGWEKADVEALGQALIATGLATAEPYSHLSLSPALCPYLAGGIEPAERAALGARWVESMRAYVGLLQQERRQNVELAAMLTVLELPNLMALLAAVEGGGDAEATIDLTTHLYGLLRNLNRPCLIKRVSGIRDTASRQLANESWGRTQFNVMVTQIEQWLAAHHVRTALAAAQRLHQRALSAGEAAYIGADYDLAGACWLYGRARYRAGQADGAIPLLLEAQRRFEAIELRLPGRGAAMAASAINERGECLRDLGRLCEAEQTFEAAVALDVQRGDVRGVAVGKSQLGTVRLLQQRHADALTAFSAALECFATLGDERAVGGLWHQIGMVQHEVGNSDAAEDCYRHSLALSVKLGDFAGQASTLNQLAALSDVLGRPEAAVIHYRQAVERYASLQDAAGEGKARNNLAETLRRGGCYAEARREIERALVCDQGLGHAAEPWKTWGILADIERDEGRVAAALHAHTQARAAYLAYRRDGGENLDPDARLAAEIGRQLAEGDAAEAAALLCELARIPNPPDWRPPFVGVLQAIVAGQRDPALADAAGLRYDSAAEILLLLDGLRAAGC